MSQSIDFVHTIDAKLASNIGEESISNWIQAVIEIVKNALDADAENVHIIFEGQKALDVDKPLKISKIIIKDDGFGMTVEDLQNKYFRIGTDNKQRNTISPMKKRRVVGEKGMGHVAAKRLGLVCKIISNPLHYSGRESSSSINKTISATINWNDFQHGLNFTDIKSKGEVTERSVDQQHGIQVEITQLRDPTISRTEFRKLQHSLGMLLVPNELKQDARDDFNIFLHEPEEDKIKEKTPIGNDLSALNMALLRLTGTRVYDKIKNETRIKYYIEKRVKSKSSPDNYIWNRVILDDRSNTVNTTILPGPSSFGDAKVVLYHFPQGGLGKFADEQKELLKLKEIQNFTKNYSGIKLFKDNVRLFPFGERTSTTMYDWTGIDKQTMVSQAGGRIRLDTVVGFLTLSGDTSKGISEVATRENVRDTPEFNDLKSFVNFAYAGLDDYKDRFTQKLKKSKTFRVDALKSKMKQVDKIIDDLVPDQVYRSEIKKSLSEVSSDITEFSKEQKQFEEDVIHQQEMYNALSSLGISTLAFEHEIGPKYTMVNALVQNLIEDPDLNKDSREDAKFASTILEDIQNWREYLDVFASTLGEMEDAKLRKNKINLRETIQRILDKTTAISPKVFTKQSKRVPIDCTVSVIGSNKTIYANRATLVAVFTNLILNSVKSLRFIHREKPRIKIIINIDTHKNSLILQFEDNGNGIPESNISKIYRPFFSSYPKHGKHAEFRGMGLGMTLSKNIIEGSYGGEIKLDKTVYDKDQPGKGMARFKITIPLDNLKEIKKKGNNKK